MMTDPIADLLTRIRNAVRIKLKTVDIPLSRAKRGVVDVLKREGWIAGYDVVEAPVQGILRIHLRYSSDGDSVIQGIERASCPGRRLYRGATALPNVHRGLGTSVVSTSKGIMADREARKAKLGGEVMVRVW